MNERIKCDFLKKRMIELREKNGKSQAEMAELIGCNKSTLSRAEKIGGETGYKTVKGFAEDYCDKLGLTPEQKSLFLRGEKIVVIDTSALLKNPQLIDELCKEYSQVIIPKIVIDELDRIKNHNANGLASKAWQLLINIGTDQADSLLFQILRLGNACSLFLLLNLRCSLFRSYNTPHLIEGIHIERQRI